MKHTRGSRSILTRRSFNFDLPQILQISQLNNQFINKNSKATKLAAHK